MTDEQKILFEYVKPKLVGVQTIVPLVYEGLIAGSEFLTYDAKKLYIAFELSVHVSILINGSDASTLLYNEVNAISIKASNDAIFFNGTVFYWANDLNLKNIYFSRLVLQNYSQIKFIGYKITIP